ncbi:MAG: DoxX family protein [Candidatus Zixiibacteriota bacterium]|nr:MAG: DoxX family protein [candidate division Zixibacteria bacterium]
MTTGIFRNIAGRPRIRITGACFQKGTAVTTDINWNSPGNGFERKNPGVDLGLLVLRVGVAAFMMFAHGADKLVNFGDKVATFPDPLGLGATASLILAVFAEFFCSLAIGFGFLTRLATIPPIITMLVAALVVHGADPFPNKELALIYFVSYLVILIAGPGRLSIDRMVLKRNREA